MTTPLAVAALALTPCGPATATASSLLTPAAHRDAAGDTPGSPLDLTGAALGQQGTQMLLRIRTAAAWDPAALSQGAGRTLCLRLFYGTLRTPRARICAAGTRDAPALRYTRLDPFGHVFRVTPLAALVDRPDERTIVATFTPGAAGLPNGRFWWQVQSHWPGAEDQVPARGNIAGRVRLLAEPPCFGAAARNPRHPCSNPRLAGVVEPAPADAVLEPNQFCLPIGDPGVLNTCRFQTPPRFAVRQTIALIGDSHAAHWRAALNIVATAKRWRGISITRSGCPFSTATPVLPDGERRRCARYKRALFRWFGRHGEVRTVFISSHIGRVVDDGRGQWATQLAGYRDAIRRLPATVRDIFVIRDTPQATRDTLTCVARAIAHHRNAGTACAVPRSYALPIDPASVAAHRMDPRRVHAIDMSQYFCGRRRCFEVIGGALVHKDTAHLTEVFSTTLGPYLLRRVNRVLARRG